MATVGGDVLVDLAGAMTGEALAGMSSDAVGAMVDTMGADAALAGMGGEQLGGMLGAMDAGQIGEAFTDQALTDVAGKMTGEDAKAMDGGMIWPKVPVAQISPVDREGL